MSLGSSRKKVNNFMICLDKGLGEGAFGKVFLAYQINNPEVFYAVKLIDKSKIQDNDYLKEALRREFKIHSQLKHPNIVNLIEMAETKNNIYVFQQYCAGTTLKQVLKEKKQLAESEVLYCMTHICKGYSQLVQKGFIHRDLKPENILISGQDLKICDFGFAKQIATQREVLSSIVGSPIYMSPQILKGQKYSSKCDVWSFGIIIFELLYGHFPWYDNKSGPQTVMGLLRQILTSPLKFPSQPSVSQKMKNFIQQCLQSDQNERLSWLQIFQHPIFEGESQLQSIAKQYRNNAQSAVKLLNQLASKVEAFQLIGAFLQFQVKALDFKLFSTIIKKYLIPQSTQAELSIMYEMFDKDNNGVIDLYEFVKAFMVCDDNILQLLNELVEEGLKYNQLKDEQLFINTAKSIKTMQGQTEQPVRKYYNQTIINAYILIKAIQYQ